MKIQARSLGAEMMLVLLVTTTTGSAVTPAPISGNCGSLALFELARTLEPANEDLSELLTVVPPRSGFSMTHLQRFSDRYRLGLVAVERARGDQLAIPSVVHWRMGHYVAITAKRA